MGVDVLVRGTTDDEFAAVRELFEQWDATFSRFRPDSELNRINADPSPVALLSRTFAYALREALAAAVTTNGLVDPTLGAALEAAGYDRDFDLLHDDDDCPPGPPSPGRWRSLRSSRPAAISRLAAAPTSAFRATTRCGWSPAGSPRAAVRNAAGGEAAIGSTTCSTRGPAVRRSRAGTR